MAAARTLVALGGNAIGRSGGTGAWNEAVLEMRRSAAGLARLVRDGHRLFLTHGNGPQVGRMLLQNEIARAEVPVRPLDVLVAESQAQIGYLIATELTPALRRVGAARTVLPFASRMVVSGSDPAFAHPDKPIGPYYSDAQARLLRKNRGWTLAADAARGGYRRVVPSPRPVAWVEARAFVALAASRAAEGIIPVVAGGGGIPVLDRGGGRYEGVEAVIDKDRSSALVGRALGARTLVVLTDVPSVLVGFRRPFERPLGQVGVAEMQGYLERGEFAAGSMAPKVEAALDFLSGGGRKVLITDSAHLAEGVADRAGTRISAAGWSGAGDA
ncbi:MAG: carbamate kinase [Thermoplasmata archaeon]